MKLLNSILVLLFFLYFTVNGLSYTRIYLMSEAETSKENLVISDVCKIEGDNIDLISNLIISPELYRDSIVDNKELYDFLSLTISDKLYIFGSGVKIKKNLIIKESELTKKVLVEKGDTIELTISKNGITIEMRGKALTSGCEKEEIDFRLSTGKVVRGRITSMKKADII